MTTIPIERQIAAVRNEIALRRRVYPRWIAGGRMSQEDGDRRIAEMEAVRATLESLRAERDAKVAPELPL